MGSSARPQAFDREWAKANGYTDAEIDEYLSQSQPAAPEATPDNRPEFLRQIQTRQPGMQPRPFDAPPKLSAGTSALLGMNQVARGATGGLSDRVLAGAASLHPDVTYGQARAKIDEGNRAFAEQNPVSNVLLGVAGGFAPGGVLGKAAGAAARMIPAARGAGAFARGAAAVGRGAAGGAASGALGAVGYQDGEDDASLGATAKNAAIGAGAGGVLGGAMVPVAAAAGKVGGVLADLTGARNMRQNVVPAGQVPRAPGEGTLLQRAGDWAEGRIIPEQMSRSADRKISEAVTRGGRDPLNRVAADLRYNNIVSGGEAAVADMGDDFGARLARGAKTKSVVASDALKNTFDGRDGRLLTNLQDDIKSTVSGPVNTVQAGRSLRQSATDGSRPLYEATAQQSVPLSDASKTVLLDRDPRGVFRAAHRIAREMAQESGEAPIPDLFAKVDDGSGRMVWGLARDVIDVREIDAMKKGIQQLAETGTRSGKTISKRRAADMLKNLSALVDDADTAVPQYAEARQAFAGPTREAEAMKVAMRGAPARGRGDVPTPRFTEGSPDELAAVVENMTPGQRDMYDVGKGAGMYRQASKDARGALRTMNKDDFGQRLRATTQQRDAGKADELLETASVRLDQAKKAAGIMSGSPTADKLVDATSAAVPAKAGQLRYAPVRAAVDMLMGRSLAGFQEGTAGEVGKRMALQGPLADDYLKYLMRLDAADQARLVGSSARNRGVLGVLLGQGMN
jgi:hypothetical protein